MRKPFFVFLFVFCSAFALFSQAIESDLDLDNQMEPQQNAELSQNQPVTPLPTLAESLRELSARLRNEATGWREDSKVLLKLVEELQRSLNEAEADRTSLRLSLMKLTELQESSKQAHLKEIATIRSALEAEIARIEGERIQAVKTAKVWKAVAFIVAGAGLGGILTVILTAY